jgi:tRNA-2-methylthio-N6-dimethylallyladenosine synthase
MPQLHMPLQSGSNHVLKAMRRSYRRDRYLDILTRVRSAIPEAAITTDIIVGFPGETESDFHDTMTLVEEARFAGAYTFLYSKRPGTPAASMAHQLSHAVVQERYERLTATVNHIAWQQNRTLEGREVEVLVSSGEGRKDAATERLTGRARDNRLVHFTPGDAVVRPGDLATVRVTHAAPHHLVSDAPVLSVRRTRAGDVWAAGTSPQTTAVSLGLPTLGPPPRAPQAALLACTDG